MICTKQRSFSSVLVGTKSQFNIQGCHILESLGFFCCPGKSLNFVYMSWKVLENIWEVFRALPGQNSEATFFNNKHKK